MGFLFGSMLPTFETYPLIKAMTVECVWFSQSCSILLSLCIAAEIKKFLEKSDLDAYTKCIEDKKPKCYTDEETCSIGKYHTSGHLCRQSKIGQHGPCFYPYPMCLKVMDPK